MEVGTIVKVNYDFESDLPGELCLHVDDIVQVEECIGSEWLSGTCEGRTGRFPSGFVTPLKVPSFQDGQELYAATNDFQATEPNDLQLERGDLILGLEAVDENWWRGQVCNQKFRCVGIFPLTHVWRLDLSGKMVTRDLGRQSVSLFATAAMDLKAQGSEELELVKGQSVHVTEIVDKDWYRGTCNGRSGTFPAAFVILEKSNETALPGISFPPTAGILTNNLTPAQDNFPLDKSIANQPTRKSHKDYLKLPNSDEGATDSVQNVETHYGYDYLNIGISPYGRILTSFKADYPNELSVSVGELVTLIRHVDNYWIEGEFNGKSGLFPQKCVEVVVDCLESGGEILSKPVDKIKEEVLPKDTFGRVLFDFKTQVEGDLILSVGDTITLLRQFNNNWYEALTDNGQVGLCPANYIEVIGACCEPAKRLEQSAKGTTLQWNLDNFSKPHSLVKFEDKIVNNPTLFEDLEARPRFQLDNEVSDSKTSSLDRNRDPKRGLLATQMSLPQFSSDSNSSSYDSLPGAEARSKPPLSRQASLGSERGSGPRRSAPPLPSSAAFSANMADCSSLTQEEIRKVIHEKENDLQRYERSMGKLRLGLSSDDAQSFSNQEMLKEIKELEWMVETLKEEIATLKGQLKSNSRTSLSSLTEEQREREETVQLRKKDSEKRKGVEKKKKTLEQRQCIIMELLQTERDYLQDLQICYQTFLENPGPGRALDLEMGTLFGNLDEVIDVAKRLLTRLQKCCKDVNAEQQAVGECFVDLAEDLKQVYGHYCRNHDEVNPLLKKYENSPAIQDYLNKGVEKMKKKSNCFDLPSVLIKPVQRILKYPLLLSELDKCTEDSHLDKVHLQKAMALMTDVAMAINEFKRRKDLVFKYRNDADTSLSFRLSKLTLHSLRKKSARISARLSSTFGLSSSTKDDIFESAEKRFHTIEKTLKIFLKDITAFVSQMQDLHKTGFNVTEDLADFYQERKNQKEVDQLRSAHRIIFTQYWQDYCTSIEKRVVVVLKRLLECFNGPHNLIQKRYDKLLDLDTCHSKADKNKDASKQKPLSDELVLAQHTYNALNAQLLDELPRMCKLSLEILEDCIRAFLHARKIFIARSASEMLTLMELPSLAGSQGDLLENFKIKHRLVSDSMSQLAFAPKQLFPSLAGSKVGPEGKRPSPNATAKNNNPRFSLGSSDLRTNVQTNQSSSQRAFVQSQYQDQALFLVLDSHTACDLLDLSIRKGELVGVLKRHDPLGNPNRWFVDNGVAKGFVPAKLLTPWSGSVELSPQSSANNSYSSAGLSSGQSSVNNSFSSVGSTSGHSSVNHSFTSPGIVSTRNSVYNEKVVSGYSSSNTSFSSTGATAASTPNSSFSVGVPSRQSLPASTPNSRLTSPASANHSTSYSSAFDSPEGNHTERRRYSNLEGSKANNLLDLSDDSKQRISPRTSSPNYAAVEEFDPCLSQPCALYESVDYQATEQGRYETVVYDKQPISQQGDYADHRYEIIPEDDASVIQAPGDRYEIIPEDDNSVNQAAGDRYENVPDNAESEYFFASYPFSACGPHQLTLVSGQVVLALHRWDLHGNSEWWFVEDRYGNQGYVPRDYLAKYENSQ